MSKGQLLRTLVNQRLTAAAEEIFGLFERTITEYEDELCRSKEENERQRQILDAVLKPQLRLHRAVSHAEDQQLVVNTEEFHPEHQEWSLSLYKENPSDPPYVKEEREELWTSQEGDQFQNLTSTSIPVFMKTEDDDESSQLIQSEPFETQSAGVECGTAGIPDFDDKTENCSDTRILKAGVYSLKNHKGVVSDTGCNAGKKLFSCFRCSKRFTLKRSLQRHMRIHTGERPFSCSLCGKRFGQKVHLQTHFKSHTGEKPFICSVCGKKFSQNAHLHSHMKCHTGEKPYQCSFCDKCFTRSDYLRTHLNSHTGEKPLSCIACQKRFTWPYQLRRHRCKLLGLEEADFTQLRTRKNEEKP